MSDDIPAEAPQRTFEQSQLAAYLRGDAAAFGEIYRRHASRILSVALAWGLDRSAAEDIVQSTFLRFHQSRNRVRVDRPLAPWLVTIATNLLRDSARKSKHHSDATEEPEQASRAGGPDVELEGRQTAIHLQSQLAQLPQAQREAVVAVRLGGLSYTEAATLLGRSEAATRQNVHRGLARLVSALQSESVRLVADEG